MGKLRKGACLTGTRVGDLDLGFGLCGIDATDSKVSLMIKTTFRGRALRTTRVGTVSLDLLDQLVVVDDSAENDVLAVQPRGLDGGDEELRSVGVGSGVGHRQETGGLQRDKRC